MYNELYILITQHKIPQTGWHAIKTILTLEYTTLSLLFIQLFCLEIHEVNKKKKSFNVCVLDLCQYKEWKSSDNFKDYFIKNIWFSK